ncbi:Outer membrane protein TolC [Prevotellaceae bacterium MN60]|nr:Outer membrane protein TolC [Prevotellaceae bacterium MN60]
MKRFLGIFLLTCATQVAGAQQLLSLDSCRALALRNNKQLSVSRVKQDVAKNIRKSARTKYLPHVTALGGYEYTSREISLLSDDVKSELSTLGSKAVGDVQAATGSLLKEFPTLAALLGQSPTLQGIMGGIEGAGNGIGQHVVDEFRSDTRNLFAGAVVVTQPIFMGGAIVALNKMADIGEEMAANSADSKHQQTLYQIDQAYWQVVSLRHKQKLAQGYLDLIKKLDSDVQKMIREGVATRSEGLSVSVKVNEAEMTLMKVNDGLTLSRMLLCQLCGLPVNEQVVLIDEEKEELETVPAAPQANVEQAMESRPELRILQNMVDLNKQTTNMLKAGNLPQVALMGGYAFSNPNLYNGFQRKFGGVWNIGILVRVPVWNWGDVAYKVRASKGAGAIARLELDEAREKIQLQVNQSTFQVNEANKTLQLAKASVERANENLRTANLGFQEGVISSTTVMEAQTAWLQAASQKIDAEINVKLSEVNLQKALGTLY